MGIDILFAEYQFSFITNGYFMINGVLFVYIHTYERAASNIVELQRKKIVGIKMRLLPEINTGSAHGKHSFIYNQRTYWYNSFRSNFINYVINH